MFQSKTTVEAVQAWVGKEFPDTVGVEGSEFIKNKDQRKWALRALLANLLIDLGKLTVFVG